MQTLVAVVTTTPSMSVKSAARYDGSWWFHRLLPLGQLVYHDYQCHRLLQEKKDIDCPKLNLRLNLPSGVLPR